MNDPTAIIQRCTAQRSNGEFCDVRSLPDAPFPICRHHAEQVYRHWDEIDDARKRLAIHLFNRPPSPPTRNAYQAQQERRKRLAEQQAVVYYVRIGDHVKIGTSTNLKMRLSQLRLDADAVLATEPGSYELERQRHREFDAERIGRREDFNPSRRLLAHIETVRAEHGDPVITTYVPAWV